MRRGRAAQRGVDQLPAPQRHRGPRPAGQGPARAPRGRQPAAHHPPGARRAVQGRRPRGRSGSRCRSGSKRSGRQGVGIFSLLRNHPFDRDFRIETRHQPLRRGARRGTGWWARASPTPIAPHAWPTPRHETRCATPWSTPTPTGPRARRCPRPGGSVVEVDEVAKAAQREVHAAHDRRHRHRAGQGTGRRAARPGARRGPAHRLPLRQQERGRGRRPWPTARATRP